MGLYFLTAGKALGMVFYKVHMCLPQWTFLAVLLVLPFQATSRQMGSNKALIWLNILTLVLAVVLPLCYMASVGAEELRPTGSKVVPVADLTIQSLLSGLCMFTFALTGQVILPEIVAEMRDPLEMPKAYSCISAPFQWAALFVAGFGGYLFIGDKVAGTIDDNVPFGVVFQVAAFCLMVHMLVSCLIKGVIVCNTVHRSLDPAHSSPSDKGWRALLGWNIIVVLVSMLAWLLANLVPFFTDAVNLMGATLIPISCWMIPIMIFARWYYDGGENRPKISKVEWLVLFLEMVLLVVLMTFATVFAVRTLMEHWSTYGQPFECHCEGMWETCACSADHIGMEATCSHPGPF
eukprot:SRR837773.14893.p2 GENE.SRR837773.14893~~SRR837773.14893.p2  ORF type:complete len:364 (-),score=146.03 SRR837773.14893:86-1132(-)